MGDLANIGTKHIESAEGLRKASYKYIVGFAIVILFCWLFAENVFYKTKYATISYNRLVSKTDSLKNIPGNWTKLQQYQYKLLKKKEEAKADSIDTDVVKAIEENVPGGFKYLLKKATEKPLGIVITSLTLLTFLIYVSNLRRAYLAKLSRGLRVLKEYGGFNTINDYGFAAPFWILPLPQDSSNGILRKDVYIITGLRRNKIFNLLKIWLFLLVVLFVQYRLFYISLITNSALFPSVLLLHSIVFVTSLMIIVNWLLPMRVSDSYNHEPTAFSLKRRDFITLSMFIVLAIGLEKSSGQLSQHLIKRKLKPRFKKRKSENKRKNNAFSCYRIEQKAFEQIAHKNLQGASDIIFTTLSAPTANIKSYTRLFNLLILLCSKEKIIYDAKYQKTLDLIRRTGDKSLIEQSVAWLRPQYQYSKRNIWNNIEIVSISK